MTEEKLEYPIIYRNEYLYAYVAPHINWVIVRQVSDVGLNYTVTHFSYGWWRSLTKAKSKAIKYCEKFREEMDGD